MRIYAQNLLKSERNDVLFLSFPASSSRNPISLLPVKPLHASCTGDTNANAYLWRQELVSCRVCLLHLQTSDLSLTEEGTSNSRARNPGLVQRHQVWHLVMTNVSCCQTVCVTSVAVCCHSARDTPLHQGLACIHVSLCVCKANKETKRI